jgi:alpha-amylase
MLMDLATETSAVADVYNNWIPQYISDYSIDGLRIDGSKQMGVEFQHDFCESAGVFCIGEVAGDDTA